MWGERKHPHTTEETKNITIVYFGYVSVMAKLCKLFGLNMLSLCNLQVGDEFLQRNYYWGKSLNDLKTILVNQIIILL